MKKIKLTNKNQTIVDDEDYEYINKRKWTFQTSGYAGRTSYKNGKFIKILLHRQIMNCPEGKEIHHKNGNKLDNRKCNLEIIDSSKHRKDHVKHLLDYQEKHKIYPDLKICENCGKEYKCNPRKRKRQKCCSKECAQKMRVRGIMKSRGFE